MSRTSARGAAWNAQRLRVLNRDGWVCATCSKHLEGDDATVDHINPITLNPGKTYADHELTAMCRRCNGIKSDRLHVRTEYRNPRWFP